MTQNRVLSFSQCNCARRCLRWWKYNYIDKIRVPQDTSYMDAGKAVHECMEQYYKDKTSNIKTFFEERWKHYNLDSTPRKKEEYYLMVLNFMEKNVELTSNEMKIFIPDNFVGYLDGVNTTDDVILDFKTSTRSAENEEEYHQQLMIYSYLYHHKFSRIPKKCVVHYLKYPGSKGELSIIPTIEDINKARDWIEGTRDLINTAIEKNEFPRCEVCHHFCPYKEICFADNKELKVHIKIIGNSIYLIGQLPAKVHKQFDKKFSYMLKEAHFIKKARPGFDGMIRFYDQRNQRLPIGFLKGVGKTLNDYAEYMKITLNLTIEDTRNKYEKTLEMPEKIIGKELRDYQIDAVNTFMKNQLGFLQIGTGAGKSLIATECIRQLACKTLFIVDKKELLYQSKKVIEEALGIEVGIIGAGEEKIKDVTVATIQTLNKNLTKYSEYLQSIMFVIFDEAHHISSTSYMKLGRFLTNTQFRLSLTGTAFRDDGNDMAMTSVGGDICFSLSAETLIAQGFLMKPNIIFRRIGLDKHEVKIKEEKTKIGLINEKDNYANLYTEFIQNNPKRNEMIFEIVKENEGKKVLILTKLIEHGQILSDMIPGAIHLYGGTNKEQRKELMKNYANDDFKIMVSTISIFAEGIDLPSLDLIINGAANVGSVKTIQVLGRVLRKNENKDMALYYDFIDDSRFFKNASRARIRTFKSEGHMVMEE